MGNQVLLKKSSVSAKVPQTTDLEYGEVALNYADGNLYFKDSSNVIKHFADSTQLPILSINNLTDVDTNTITPTLNQTLVWNGTNWVPGISDIIIKDTEALVTTDPTQTVDTYSKTSYRTVKYLLQAISGGEVHTTEVTLTHNDVDVFVIEYGTIYTGAAALITVTADIDTTNVYLKVTPATANTTIDFTRISLIARTLAGGGDLQGDLMTQSGSEDLMAGSGTTDLMA